MHAENFALYGCSQGQVVEELIDAAPHEYALLRSATQPHAELTILWQSIPRFHELRQLDETVVMWCGVLSRSAGIRQQTQFANISA